MKLLREPKSKIKLMYYYCKHSDSYGYMIPYNICDYLISLNYLNTINISMNLLISICKIHSILHCHISNFWVCTAHLLLLNQVKYRKADIEDLQTYEISGHLIHKENICLTSLEPSSFFNLKHAQGALLLSFLVLVLLLAALGLIPFA